MNYSIQYEVGTIYGEDKDDFNSIHILRLSVGKNALTLYKIGDLSSQEYLVANAHEIVQRSKNSRLVSSGVTSLQVIEDLPETLEKVLTFVLRNAFDPSTTPGHLTVFYFQNGKYFLFDVLVKAAERKEGLVWKQTISIYDRYHVWSDWQDEESPRSSGMFWQSGLTETTPDSLLFAKQPFKKMNVLPRDLHQALTEPIIPLISALLQLPTPKAK